MRCALAHFAFAAAMLWAGAASAQHLWLEPREFNLEPRDAVPVKMVGADRLKAPREEHKFDAARIEIFQRLSSAGTADIPIKGTPRPAYTFHAGRSGTYVLALELGWTRGELEAERFEALLKSQGLESVLAERARLGENAKAGRERHHRSLKTMLQVGRSTDGSYADVAGQRLEVVPQTNPFSARIGQPFVVRVTFEGKPLAGRLLVAEQADGAMQSARTDADGKAAIGIDERGLWLLHVVHKRRCLAADCDGADWESYWSSLTFAR